MSKKSQVTIFIILGIIIVFIIGFLVLLKYTNFNAYFDNLNIEKFSVSPQIKNVNDFVIDCLELSGEEALYFIGQHGGYYNEKIQNYNGIPYYLNEGKILVPEKGKIEIELSKYVNDALVICINNFEDFPNFNITKGTIKTKTIISDKEVSFNLDYPLTIKKQKAVYRLKSFDYKSPLRLGIIYNVSYSIINELAKNKSEICLSCLSDLTLKNEMHLIARSYDNNVTVYTIADQIYYLDINRYSPDLFGFGNYNYKFAVRD